MGAPATPFGGITGATQAPARPMLPFLGGFSPTTTPSFPVPIAAGIGATDYAVNPQNRAETEFPPATSQSLGNVSPSPPAMAMGANASAGGSTGSKLLDTLRGVKAPPAPEHQTVRTPPPPQATPIRGGELLSLMTSLGVTPQEFLRMSQLRFGR